MKFEFPEYESNGVKKWRAKSKREADENNYYKSIDDFRNFINIQFQPRVAVRTGFDYELTINQKRKILDEIKDDVINSIKNNKMFLFLSRDFNEKRQSLQSVLKDFPYDVIDFYKEKVNKLIEIERCNVIKSRKFINDNSTEVFIMFDTIYNELKLLLKEKKKQYNENYNNKHNKKKLLVEIVSQNLLTEEQKVERRKLAQQKYRETHKIVKEPRILLTDEEKIERKKLANKKYYNKIKVKSKVDEIVEYDEEGNVL